jgi:hypothetical protein
VPDDDADAAAVRSIAVTVADVLTAFEANRQTGAETVLRVTPPFSGRMRARLHRLDDPTGGEDPTDGSPAGDDAVQIAPDAGAGGPLVYVRPEDLLSATAPAYPHPDETEDELRRDPDVAYTRERHRRRHAEAVAAWRERARDHLVDAAPLRTPDGHREVEVVALG